MATNKEKWAGPSFSGGNGRLPVGSAHSTHSYCSLYNLYYSLTQSRREVAATLGGFCSHSFLLLTTYSHSFLLYTALTIYYSPLNFCMHYFFVAPLFVRTWTGNGYPEAKIGGHKLSIFLFSLFFLSEKLFLALSMVTLPSSWSWGRRLVLHLYFRNEYFRWWLPSLPHTSASPMLLFPIIYPFYLVHQFFH